MNLNEEPIISVILPVYNADKYLQSAIDSILNQTYTNFELFLMDDGSTDGSANIIAGNASNDSRIKSIKNSENKGLIYTLNKGLNLVNGKYIARMDADDKAHPERFREQVDYMELHPDIDLLGTNYSIIGNRTGESDLPLNSEEISLFLYFKNVIAHPTVMMRTTVIKEHQIKYNPKAIHMEDWALWLELKKYCKIANHKSSLLEYRIEGQNISIKNWETRQERATEILKFHLDDIYNVKISEELLLWHWKLANQLYENEPVSLISNKIKNLQNNLKSNTEYSSGTINKLIGSISQSYVYKITDCSAIKGLKYMILSKSYNWRSLRYIIGKSISKH